MDQPPRQGNGGGNRKKKRNGRDKDGSQKPHTPPSPQTSTPSSGASLTPEDSASSLQQLTIESEVSQQLTIEPTLDEETPPGVQFVPDPILPETAGATPSATPETTSATVVTEQTTTPAIHTERKFYPPKRPDFGKLGRKIPLLVNYFPLEIKGGEIIQYDVKVFTEEMVARKGYEGNGMTDRDEKAYVMKEFLENCKTYYPREYPVYDGRSIMYTKQPLKAANPFIKHEIEWRDPDDGKNGVKRKAHVILKPSNKVDLSILNHFVNRSEHYRTGTERETQLDYLQEAITAIDIILKELPKSTAVSLGRTFYYKPRSLDENNDIGGGRWIWDGFSQSVRPGQWKAFINIDKSCGIFVKPQPLLEFIHELVGSGDVNSRKNKQKISDHLADLRVIAKHLKYPKRQRIVSRGPLLKSARDEIFDKDGRKMSVEQYFLQQYQIKLAHPLYPCINVGKPATKNSPGKRIALPMELCVIKDVQRSGQDLEPDQTTKVLKVAARPAPERRDMINQIASSVLGQPDQVQKHYGIKTDSRMLQVEGRVLTPPYILYDNNSRAEPVKGQWDITRYRLLQAKPMSDWVLIDFVRTRDEAIRGFTRELIAQGGSKGMDIAPPHEVIKREPQSDTDVRKLLLELKSYFGDKLQLILIILDERMQPRKFSSVVYREIKKVGDTEIGVPTQCVKQLNVNKANGSTVGNICLKINAKLGGVNHGIILDGTPTAELLKVPTMFMGADVNHPKPGTDRYTPSIAAAVATIDRRLAKYASSCRFQQHERAEADTSTGAKRRYRKEIIIEFKEMAKELINAFMEYNKGRKPMKIIYYRDGVSEGQFMQVLQHELLALRAACTEIDAEYRPTMTIIIVQKRHHLRMFPYSPRDETGKARNIPPGTTLDHSVTHQLEFNFYLNSHFALQGTAKCALYHVLWDENDFKSDSLQAITYQLCHTYARCAKSVSYPTPVYYSHWVAFRYNKSAGYGDPDRDRNQLIAPNGDWDQFRRKVITELGTMYWA